jgi:hypothetical protein
MVTRCVLLLKHIRDEDNGFLCLGAVENIFGRKEPV